MKNPFANQLRKQSTDAESKLWYHLRNRRFYSYKFRRQLPIQNYIVDFVCLEKKLIIELDGGQHAENINYDNKRTAILNALGYKVLRFWNNDILNNIYTILSCIKDQLESPPSIPAQKMANLYHGKNR